nr:MAG TPA: hypothetical protein [Caudoviricetes sp.]
MLQNTLTLFSKEQPKQHIYLYYKNSNYSFQL